ncbi:MAG: DUF983 domain-containing protein [Chloroflexota bacterium]|nr:DUF983 domain-containing protein [Chloroflexota bacterium]
MTLGQVVHKLWIGTLLRCPHCEQGRTFSGLFRVEKTCAHCGYQFELRDGESVGGMYINLVLAELTTMGGFFLIQALFNPPWLPHLVFWVIWNLAFVFLFYRHARSMWMAISYLTGGEERRQAVK